MDQIKNTIPEIPKPDAAPSYDDVVKMRVKSYNSMHGKLEGYDCPECLNKGYIAKISNGDEVMAECKCMKIRSTLDRIKRSGLEKQLKSCTFKNFQTDSKWQRQMKAAATEFVKSDSIGFFIGGQSGCGKTHICTAMIGNFIKQGLSARYFVWREDSTMLKAVVNDREYTDCMNEFKTADVLYILKSAKSTASSLINAGINGYVVVNPNEILIMDTPDKATATKVWRWNSGGFGYSSTGYDGEYGTAITMDGAIVADFITAGILRGLEIINGDGTFHVASDGSVTASAINITGGSINVETDSENYDVIELSCREWTAQISPAQLLLKNDSINAKVLIQAGAMYFYTNDENRLILSSDGSIISKGVIQAEDFYIKKSDDTIISVKNAIGG